MGGILDGLPCQEDNVPSILDERNTLANKLSNSAFGPVASDCVADGTTSSHTKPGDAIFIGMFDQHNKRVGIRLP